MEYHLRTKLNGNIAMTSCFHENSFLQRDRSLYKFIWVRHGALDVEVDHVVMHLEKEEMISLTPLHHVQIRGVGVNTSLFYSIVTFIVFTGMTARCLVTDSCLTVLPVSCV